MHRLRRIVPAGCKILVGYWVGDEGQARIKSLEETAEADAFATSFHEAGEFAVNAARRSEPELVVRETTKVPSRTELKIVPRSDEPHAG